MLPPFLRMRTWVDLRNGIGKTNGFDAFCRAVRRLQANIDASIPRQHDDICPYRGLESFDEAHADFFFGREGEIQRLLEPLKVGRFLAVVGPSGTGKSSLVRAGLIPALRRGALPNSQQWQIRVLRPGVRPLTDLAAELAKLLPRFSVAELLAQLLSDQRTLDFATVLAPSVRSDGTRLLWVIDQFEEVFTLCNDQRERDAFIANLLYAAAVPGGRSV